MRYKRTRKTARGIADELGADYLLESTFRRDELSVRVTARLVRARDQAQVGAETTIAIGNPLSSFRKSLERPSRSTYRSGSREKPRPLTRVRRPEIPTPMTCTCAESITGTRFGPRPCGAPSSASKRRYRRIPALRSLGRDWPIRTRCSPSPAMAIRPSYGRRPATRLMKPFGCNRRQPNPAPPRAWLASGWIGIGAARNRNSGARSSSIRVTLRDTAFWHTFCPTWGATPKHSRLWAMPAGSIPCRRPSMGSRGNCLSRPGSSSRQKTRRACSGAPLRILAGASHLREGL